MPDNKTQKNYFEQKLHCLKKVRKLLKEEEEAILAANLEGINASIKEIEGLQIKIDNLEHRQKKSEAVVSEKESEELRELLSDILTLSKTNGELLLNLKESILEEIKTAQLKKNAHSVYCNQVQNVGSAQSTG